MMPACKICGRWFAKIRDDEELCDKCGVALSRLSGYAVPVVRCKDCKWFADNNDGDWFGCWLFQTIQIIPEDAPKPEDFCSYGEPKMDGGGDR